MTKKKIQYIALAAILGLLVWGFYNPYRRKNEIRRHARFTVGVVYKESGSLNNGEHYHYKFHYNGNEYESYNSKNRNYKVNFGDRFIIEFASNDPTIAILHYEWPLPQNAGPFPDTGWNKVPLQILNKGQHAE